jgi:hypothetical protein
MWWLLGWLALAGLALTGWHLFVAPRLWSRGR